MKVKIRKSDKLFAIAVKDAVDWFCQSCGKNCNDGSLLDCAHNFSRRSSWTRHDPRNVAALCRGCHMKFTQEPHDHVEFFKTLPHYDLMMVRAKGVFKRPKDYEAQMVAHWGREITRVGDKRMDGITSDIELRVPEIYG